MENEEKIIDCNCSRERMRKGLKSIGKEELQIILEEDGQAELVCNFCNKKYNFSKEDLKNIIEEI